MVDVIAVGQAAQVGLKDQLVVLDHQKRQRAHETLGTQQLVVDRGQGLRIQPHAFGRSDGPSVVQGLGLGGPPMLEILVEQAARAQRRQEKREPYPFHRHPQARLA